MGRRGSQPDARVGGKGPVSAEQDEPVRVAPELVDDVLQPEVVAAGVQRDAEVLGYLPVGTQQLGGAAAGGEPQPGTPVGRPGAAGLRRPAGWPALTATAKRSSTTGRRANPLGHGWPRSWARPKQASSSPRSSASRAAPRLRRMLSSMVSSGSSPSRRRTMRSGACTCPQTSKRSGQDTGRADSAAASAAARSALACGRKRWPALVSSTRGLPRMNSGSPSAVLQPLDALGEGLLGEEQPGGGAAEVQLLGGDNERPHLGEVQLHVSELGQQPRVVNPAPNSCWTPRSGCGALGAWDA